VDNLLTDIFSGIFDHFSLHMRQNGSISISGLKSDITDFLSGMSTTGRKSLITIFLSKKWEILVNGQYFI